MITESLASNSCIQKTDSSGKNMKMGKFLMELSTEQPKSDMNWNLSML